MKNLTTGSIPRNIITLALPIIGAAFLQFAYNFIDMLWVGKLGSEAVAALGTSSFFLHLGWAFISIILVGGNIKVAQSIGKKDEPKAQRYAQSALIGTWTASLLYIAIIAIGHKEMIGFFDLNNPTTEGMAHNYLRIASTGILFLFTTQLFTGVSNGRGDSKTPFRVTVVGVILNIILDPIFIFTLDMGVSGAALATVISQFISMLIFWLRYADKFIGKFDIKRFSPVDFKTMCKLGFPPSMQRILFTIVGITMAKIISNWGGDAIAAQKIGLQIEAMTFMTVGGLTNAILSFTGQNFGKGAFDRVRKGYKVSLVIAITLGAIMTSIFYTFSEEMVRWFTDDPEVVVIGSSYLRIIGISQVFMCIEMMTSGVINGIGRTKIPATVNTSFTLIRIPLALWLSSYDGIGIDGIWYAILISTVLRGTVLTIVYHSIKKATIPYGVKIDD